MFHLCPMYMAIRVTKRDAKQKNIHDASNYKQYYSQGHLKRINKRAQMTGEKGE